MLTRRRTGRRREGPIVEKPAINTIYICDRPVCLRSIARVQNIERSYLTKIMNGTRSAGINYYIKIAAAIGVTVDELVAGIAKRVQDDRSKKEMTLEQYNNRVKKEDARDNYLKRIGRPVKPRMPGLRLPK